MITTIPSILRGSLYDTPNRKGCPRFHMCLASMKCQSYDSNVRECYLCEQRVTEWIQEDQMNRPTRILGGYSPERKYIPDIQLSIKVLEDYLGAPFRRLDTNKRPITSEGISIDYENYKKATKTMQTFYEKGLFKDY